MWSYATWGLINISLFGYLMFFEVVFWRFWSYRDHNCISNLVWWALIYILIQLGHIVRKGIIIYIWKTAKDPTIACTKMDLISLPFLVLPELCWYIYGNILMYNEEVMLNCKELYPLFWSSILVLLIYGYLFMFGILLMILAALAIFCYFKTN